MNLAQQRLRMVERQLESRGIDDELVLRAFATVPREVFVPEGLAEFAYHDAPLPIGGGQTISQPYIVALTVEAMQVRPGNRVLEIGTGSGYAAAILSRMVDEVYTVERVEALAEQARGRLAELGYDNVHILVGDGTRGWAEHAPYDAIAVAAGGPEVPRSLLAQLAPGGRLIIPIGPGETEQVLVRITRQSDGSFTQENLASVRFVPLIGEEGWPEREPVVRARSMPRSETSVSHLVREVAEPISDWECKAIEGLLSRIGDSRLVLLGEATHGTSEFYRMRAHITRLLIERCGFDFVAVEADWPDAARADSYVRGKAPATVVDFTPFARFPTWMWRNQEVSSFLDWLRQHNDEQRSPDKRAGFHGLDLYSMYTSMAVVLAYLDQVDPDAAVAARRRYGTLTPWQKDPAAYGQAVLVGKYESSEGAVVATLKDMLARRIDYAIHDGERFFDAAQNARVVANAENYYRAMYYGPVRSWNLRDTHMFDTLQALFKFYGPDSRGVVWEHNSHIGNAAATELAARGELNVGQLCRSEYGDDVYIVGFGTDHGIVAAAPYWDGEMERMAVRPALDGSYEKIFHDAQLPAFTLRLRDPVRMAVREELMRSRLNRAIGVVYRPETERQSHYFYTTMPHQFDELIWFDETSAITPLATRPQPSTELPDTYPFGL